MPRSKGAAAALDFFIWGSGHAYLGRRKALGFPWVIWTMFLALYTIIDVYVAQYTTAFYYIDYSNGFGQLAYNTGEAAAVAFVPFLIVGGLMVLDLMRSGAIPRVGPFGGQQAAPVMQQTSFAQQTGGMVCPSCGVGVTAADAFCPSCGTNLRATAPPMAAPSVASSGGKVCNSCGTANPAGYAFCKRCGSKLT